MNGPYRRIFLIVSDFLGIGGAEDAADFGDAGADTLGHISAAADRLEIPNLRYLGLANLKQLRQAEPYVTPMGRYCTLREKSRGKDTVTGCREMMGIDTEKPLIPFPGNADRRDEAPRPLQPTALNALQDAGYDVFGVGKIHDIFNGYGIGRAPHSENSGNGMDQTIGICRNEDFTGLCFVDPADFDARREHRRDPFGYAEEIMRFDEKLGELMKACRRDDLVILTADHGNDPTRTGTGPTRENVCFLAWSPVIRNSTGGPIPGADTFAMIGATICDNFGVSLPEGTIGTSHLGDLL